jgi:hypothetical protein
VFEEGRDRASWFSEKVPEQVSGGLHGGTEEAATASVPGAAGIHYAVELERMDVTL